MVTIKIEQLGVGDWTWTISSDSPPIARIGVAGDVESMAERIYETLTTKLVEDAS